MSDYQKQKLLRLAAIELGHAEPISVEPDGTIWLGIDPNRTYLTDKEQLAVAKKAEQNAQTAIAARVSALAKLEGLGLTPAEIAALVGA